MSVFARVKARAARLLRSGPALALLGALALIGGGSTPLAWGAPPAKGSPPRGVEAFTFTHENVLGTSLRLVIVAESHSKAEAAERVALQSIEAERMIFSTYDSESELSQINALPWEERRDLSVSPHLGNVLNDARDWRRRSGGAFDAYAGLLSARWRRASREGAPPSDAELESLRRAPSAPPGFHAPRHHKRRRLTCTGAGRFDLGAIAKGFIIDRALHAVRKAHLGVRGALLDIGGDVRVFGASPDGRRRPWRVGVANPSASTDNAQPLAEVALRDQAIASSGGYARPLVVDGARHSHILDPRSGQPADEVLGATAIAGDAETADALATILCVLDTDAALALIDHTAGAAGLVIDASGVAHPSKRWARILAKASSNSSSLSASAKRSSGATRAWPRGFSARVAFTLVNSSATVGRRAQPFRRHGVAVWVEDGAGKCVRILALWMRRSEMKHVKGLRTFWQRGGARAGLGGLSTISRATRPPGQYTLDWDGRDDAGRALPRGRYRVRIDVNREHGPPRGHERETVASVDIDCGAKASSARASDQPELTGVSARYGRFGG